MKVVIKCFLISICLVFFTAQGISQITLNTAINNQPQIKLIPALDLLYDVSESKNVSILKYKSIFNANKLPLFCKFEHKLAKSSNVNLRMRLGSLDYVNKLEGKN